MDKGRDSANVLCNWMGTREDRGVSRFWLREMSDLREGREVLGPRRICELCFFVTQGFMNNGKSGDG